MARVVRRCVEAITGWLSSLGGATGCVVLFEVVGDEVVPGAVCHQREDDYRH